MQLVQFVSSSTDRLGRWAQRIFVGSELDGIGNPVFPLTSSIGLTRQVGHQPPDIVWDAMDRIHMPARVRAQDLQEEIPSSFLMAFSLPSSLCPLRSIEKHVLPGFILQWAGLDFRQVDAAFGKRLQHAMQNPRLILYRKNQRCLSSLLGVESSCPIIKNRVMLLL